MSQPTHPLLSLVESNRNGLKSMLTSYIDATVDSHYNAIKQNIVEMIQSGMIGPQQCYDITGFGTTLPQVAQSNTDQSSAHCLSEYSNGTLTRAQQHQNNLQNEVSLSNTINTESMIKQEFDDGEEDGEEIDDGNVEKCEKRTSNLDRENDDNTHDDTDTGKNENVSVGDDDEADIETKHFDKSQSQIAICVSNNVQIKNQNDDKNVINERSVSERNMEQSTPSTSGVRSSTRNRIKTKVFGDLVQSNVNPRNSRNCKSDQQNKSLKKVKRKQTLEDEEDTDSDDTDDQEEHTNNAIGEEISNKCTTNPNQPNLAQPNRHLQCPHCHKSFDRKSTLQNHLRVHTGERPFQCDQCAKRFNRLGHLTTHQLIHQNIKRFRCDQCYKKFTQKVTLDKHLRTHSGERPFQCSFCDKSFTELSQRNKHEQAIHLHVKPYRCKQCDHTATERSCLIKHIRFVHFGLPRTIKQQRALNIIDERDPRELLEKV